MVCVVATLSTKQSRSASKMKKQSTLLELTPKQLSIVHNLPTRPLEWLGGLESFQSPLDADDELGVEIWDWSVCFVYRFGDFFG